MRLVQKIKTKMNSIRRRILVTVSVVYLVCAAVSACWIYYEVTHEVDELFDAEMVQQAKTIAALTGLMGNSTPAGLKLAAINAHEYEDKVAFRIENDAGVVMQTASAPAVGEIAYRPGFQFVSVGDLHWHAFGMSVPQSDCRLLILQEDAFRSELRTDLTVDTVIPVLIMLPLMMWLAWWSINRHFGSFERLAAALRRRKADDYAPFEEAKDTEEVALVKRSLNHYLNRIEQTFLREKRFSADAAHELRTPLASLKAHLQSLISQTSGDNKASLVPLLKSTEQLIKLVESLLLLSKGELNAVPKVTVNVAAELREALASYYSQAEEKRLTYDIDLPQSILLRSNRHYWQLLLTNVIDNAVKYAPKGTLIQISASQHELEVSNAIDEHHVVDAERLTERFYRGKQLGVEGSGLGLSIVQNLAQQLDLQVEFSVREQCFSCRILWS